jgi:signal-transduction protein with cAMP-binding, CBS, and nucleotidyltransferase domain
MNIDLRLISTAATVKEAALMMRDNGIGFLPVCGEEGRLVGVLTDRDVATRAATLDRAPSAISVGEVMTARPAVCRAGDGVREAEARMIRRGVSRVVVVDEDGHPVGVISLTDILSKDRKGRALRTARRVLAREAEGPHTPIESITLTASDPGEVFPGVSGEQNNPRSNFDAVIIGGSDTRQMKEFPR